LELENLKERLRKVPKQPGVYIFKDKDDAVIYVGKAVVLRNRMRSYFQSREKQHPKVKALMNRVNDFDFIVTATEVEALILENNLIKQHKPRYNIDLRDDKTYPYVKITTGQEYPRMYITRERKDGVSRYFGPYTDVTSLRETIKLINSIFPMRMCRNFKRRSRPCLNWDLKKCLAPCTGKVPVEEYLKMVDCVIKFLEGDIKALLNEQELQMKQAAANLEFEKAARLRDQINSIKKINSKQNINFEKPYNLDVAAIRQGDKSALVLLFKIRAGKIVDRYASWINRAIEEDANQLMQYFLQHYYDDNSDIPAEILLNLLPANLPLVEEWLRAKTGRHIKVAQPQRGQKRVMLQMLEENLNLIFQARLEREQSKEQVLVLLSKELNLEVIPQRIECYDISHLAGEETVGSMVVFTNGSPDKSCYRRFKITQDQNNDFASLAETIKRRFNEARKGNPAFLPEPDLIIIDGGLGQVNAVNKILNEADLEIPLFSLAKQEEVIYQPNNADPIKLGRNNEALKLLQRLRDEAHRFAIEYNRQRRQKKLRSSSLDKIPNIGPQRKKALRAYFGSARKVKEAELAELEKVPGFSKNLALNIYQYFHQDNDVSIQE
jgi:excinuclease ABC subunit C